MMPAGTGYVETSMSRPARRLRRTRERHPTPKEGDVKYLLLIYNNPATWDELSDEERTGLMNGADALMKELQGTGEMVGGYPLADPSNSRAIRVRAGAPAITDGPFLEAKEHLAGFCVLECESLERATEIALRWPDARYTGVELRPVMDPDGGLEM
jgi:hypothetical protein